MGGFGAKTPSDIQRQLRVCEDNDLALIAAMHNSSWDPRSFPVDTLPTGGPLLWGYQVWDEPKPADFPVVQNISRSIRAARPSKLPYFNMDYARHDSAEDFCRLDALLFSSIMAWIFIPARCFAIP